MDIATMGSVSSAAAAASEAGVVAGTSGEAFVARLLPSTLLLGLRDRAGSRAYRVVWCCLFGVWVCVRAFRRPDRARMCMRSMLQDTRQDPTRRTQIQTAASRLRAVLRIFPRALPERDPCVQGDVLDRYVRFAMRCV